MVRTGFFINDVSNNLDHFKLFYMIYYVVSLLYLIKCSAFTNNIGVITGKTSECQIYRSLFAYAYIIDVIVSPHFLRGSF